MSKIINLICEIVLLILCIVLVYYDADVRFIVYACTLYLGVVIRGLKE